MSETIELTKKQTESILSNFPEKNGLSLVLHLIHNLMMVSERNAHQELASGNGDNDYWLA